MIEVTDEMWMVAYRAAREWALIHRHQQPDDRLIKAALSAVLAIVERDYEPIRCDDLNWTTRRCTKPRGHEGGHQHRWSGVVWP